MNAYDMAANILGSWCVLIHLIFTKTLRNKFEYHFYLTKKLTDKKFKKFAYSKQMTEMYWYEPRYSIFRVHTPSQSPITASLKYYFVILKTYSTLKYNWNSHSYKKIYPKSSLINYLVINTCQMLNSFL